MQQEIVQYKKIQLYIEPYLFLIPYIIILLKGYKGFKKLLAVMVTCPVMETGIYPKSFGKV